MSKRYTVEPKDLMALNGKSERHCRRIIATIKQKNNVPANSDLPLHILCTSLGWNEEKVRGLLSD